MKNKFLELWNTYPKQFWIITFGVLISSSGASIIWPFQLIYVSEVLGKPISTIATLVSISSLFALAASPLGGMVADLFGRKRVMITAQVLHGVAFLILSQSSTYVWFLIPMAMIGMAMPLFSVGSDAMMADLIHTEKRSSAYSILRMFNNTGVAIGPAIGGILVSKSYQTAFYFAAAGMLVFGLYLAIFTHETLDKALISDNHADNDIFKGYLRVIKDTRFDAFVFAFAIGVMAPMLLWMLLALYAKNYFGISESQYSWIPMTNALMCVTLQVVVTRMFRRIRVEYTIITGMFLYAIGVGSVALMTSFMGFWSSMVLMTFGELVLIPTATKFIADIAPADLRGRYMSFYWLAWGISRAVAPVLGGALHDNIAPVAIWWGGLTLGLTSVALLFTLLIVRPSKILSKAV